MKKSLLATVVLATLLAACSNNAVKNQPAAPVEDASKSAAQQSSSAGDNGASTASATQDSVGANPLKDPNNILSKRSVFFDFDKDEVKPEYRALVEAHGKYLVANPNAKLSIQGNADSRGSREYNLALGQRRSDAVRKSLNLMGVSDDQMEAVSFGKEKPKAEGDNEAAWAENRRADIVYITN